MEPEFLRFGGGLEALSGQARGIVAAGSRLVAEVEARLQTLRDAGLGMLVASIHDALQAGLKASAEQLASLEGNAEAMHTLRDLGQRIRVLSTQLSVTRLGFSIESARLVGEQQAAFLDFVAQLSEQVTVFGKLGNAVVETATAAKNSQRGAAESIRQGFEELRVLSRHGATVAASAEQRVEALLQAIDEVATRVASGVAVARQRIDGIVYFLQIGDIVRQKVEHVAAALHRLPAAAGSRAGVLRLQIAQLAGVETSLERAHEELRGAFVGLGEATEGIVAPLADLSAGGGAAVFDGLVGDTRSMFGLQGRVAELGSRSAAAAEQAKVAGETIVKQLAEITETNAAMHMMALNAIVNTSRLGSAASALGVLSVHVHEIARASGELVVEVRNLVGKVQAGVGSVAAAATSDRHADVMAHFAGIDQLRQLIREAAADAADLAEAQARGIAAATADLNCLLVMRRRLAALRTELEGALAAHGAGADLGAEESAQLMAAYTMESEREIHRQVFAGAASAPVAAAAGDLGDNVELF